MLLLKRAGKRNSEGVKGVVRNEDEEECCRGRDHGAGTWDWLTLPGRDCPSYRPGGESHYTGCQEEGRVLRGRLLWKQLPSAACPCDRQARLRSLLLLGK